MLLRLWSSDGIGHVYGLDIEIGLDAAGVPMVKSQKTEHVDLQKIREQEG